MIDWTTIIVALLGYLGIDTVLKAIDHYRNKKENKKLKKDEVLKAENDTDRQQIDLGDLFLEKTKKWAEIIETGNERMIAILDENNKRRDEDWRELKGDMEYVKSEVRSMSDYLNGDYKKYKEKHGYGTKAQKRPVPRKKGFEGQQPSVQ